MRKDNFRCFGTGDLDLYEFPGRVAKPIFKNYLFGFCESILHGTDSSPHEEAFRNHTAQILVELEAAQNYIVVR